MMYKLKGGAVPIPRWILVIRALQLFFAILVLGTTASALSVFGGGPLQPPLIATIIIAVLTIVPILLLTTPLHLMQRKFYDPRIALMLDGFAMLYWLAAFTAMACYHDIFRSYGRGFTVFAGDSDFVECRSCRKAWRTGTAATVFSAIEFLLFLFSTLTFIYYYHFHLSGQTAPGIGSRGVGHTGAGAAETGLGTGVGTAGPATAGATEATAGNHTHGEHHQMGTLPQQSTHTGPGHTGSGHTGIAGGHGTGLQNDVPYPTTPHRAGVHENAPHAGLGSEIRRVWRF